MFKKEALEARLKELKDEYEAEVAKVKASESLLAEKDKAVKELAAAKDALKVAQKNHKDIVAQIDKALGKKKAPKSSGDGTKTRSSGKKDKILNYLAGVYPEAKSIVEIEKATGEGNVGVWFSTTGKKITGIVKAGRGQYSYKDSAGKPAPAPTELL